MEQIREEAKASNQGDSDSAQDNFGDPLQLNSGKGVSKPTDGAKAKRGRKAIPQQWSRVIDLSGGAEEENQCFVINEDMQALSDHPLKPPGKNKQHWAPLFASDQFWSESKRHKLAENVLSKRQLKHFGKRVTNLRQHFVDEAVLVLEDAGKNIQDDLQATSKLSNRIRDRETGMKDNLNSFKPQEFVEPTSLANRYKSKNREPLSLTDKIDIVMKIKFQFVPWRDVGKEYRVSDSAMQQLMSKMRKDQNFIRDLAKKKRERERARERVADAI